MSFADDEECREIARDIEQESHGWFVVWGVYSRQFVAFPLFDAPQGTILTANYPDALAGRMEETRRKLGYHPEKEDSSAGDA